jgi:hypothetical protein
MNLKEKIIENYIYFQPTLPGFFLSVKGFQSCKEKLIRCKNLVAMTGNKEQKKILCYGTKSPRV